MDNDEVDNPPSLPSHGQRGSGGCWPHIDHEPRATSIRRWLWGGSALSMIFAYVGVSGCSFLRMSYSTEGLLNPYVLGLFNMAIYDEGGSIYGCVPQNGDDQFKDGAFMAGKTFGVLTAMLTTIMVILVGWVLLVMRPHWADRAWRYLQVLCGITLFCQLFTFAAFGSTVCSHVDVESFGSVVTIETQCNAGAASALAAVNVLLLLTLTGLACAVPAPIHPYFIRWTEDDDFDVSRGNDSASFADDDDGSYHDSNDSTDDGLFDDGEDRKFHGRTKDKRSKGEHKPSKKKKKKKKKRDDSPAGVVAVEDGVGLT